MSDTHSAAGSQRPKGIAIRAVQMFGRRETDIQKFIRQPSRRRDAAVRKFFVYSILGLLSIIALLESYALKPHLAIENGEVVSVDAGADFKASFLKDLGIAGLVAIILAITFERLSAQEFENIARRERRRVKRDVFYYVYGHHVPHTIREEIHTRVLTSKFVRDCIELSYTLTPIELDGGGRYMQIDLVAKYSVRNLTNRAREYRLEAELEKPPVPALAERVTFPFLQVSGSETPIPRTETPALLAQDIIKDHGISVLLTPPPPVVLPGVPAVVTVAYRTITHLDGGYDYFTFTDHTCETQVLVNLPDRRFTVALRDFGGKELAKHPVWHHPEQGRFHWQSTTPILANQGIYIAWTPRDEPAHAAAPSASREVDAAGLPDLPAEGGGAPAAEPAPHLPG